MNEHLETPAPVLRNSRWGEDQFLVSTVTRKVSHVAMNFTLLIRKSFSNFFISRHYVNYSCGRFLDLLYFDLYSVKMVFVSPSKQQ